MKVIHGASLNKYLKELGLDDSFASKDNEHILKFLSQFNSTSGSNSNDNGVTVFRARLILVGAGNVGKTTLVKRLKENVIGRMKQDKRTMTDGIDISEIKFNVDASTEVVLTVMDFAGQKDYMQTHSLFFKKDAIFLVLHKHDYENGTGANEKENELTLFLTMIESCAFDARVIFALTHCDDKKRGSWDKLSELKQQYRLKFITNEPLRIDSIAGLNIDALMNMLLEEARTDKNKVRVPSSFYKFKDELASMTAFSVTDTEFTQISKKCLEDDVISLAKDVFEQWGIIYLLSNGDIILKPQNLADIFSCLFTREGTTLNRIQSHIFGGYLRHTKQSLEAIWGIKKINGEYEYPKALWSPGSSSTTTPFIDLLHQSGLAYPITSTSGKPLSVIPYLLPDAPLDLPNFADMSEKQMFESLFKKDVYKTIHTTMSITFNPHLPTTFVGQLQSKLSRLTLKGGAWQTGCALQYKDNKSCAVFCLSRSNSNAITVYSGGYDKSYTHARDIVVTAVSDLIRDKFESLVCEVSAVADVVKAAAKESFRWTVFSNRKEEGFQFSNLIDKDGMHNISIQSTGSKAGTSKKFDCTSLDNLYNNHKITSEEKVTNYLWYSIQDLLKITIGQTREWNNSDHLQGLWLVFKDDNSSIGQLFKSNQEFHAIHFYYSDARGKWLHDVEYHPGKSETIRFTLPADSISKHASSDSIIEMMKDILKNRFKVKLPSVLSNESIDLWSLLVTVSIDDKTAEILEKHEFDSIDTFQTLREKEPKIRRL